MKTKLNEKPKAAHSEIGASSMERWSQCPASVRLSRGMPSESSVYAQAGTEAHELAADWLLKGFEPKDADDETYQAVKVYVDHINDRWRNLKRHAKSIRLVEHRFDLSNVYPGLFGTADCVIYDGAEKILYVVDYKHGQGIPVDPDNNPQLKYYGLGALMSMELPVEKVVLEIVQPRYSPDISKAIKSAVVEPYDMLEFAADLKDFAERTDDPNAPVVMGDHCQFCKARPICPALREAAEIAVRKDFAPENLPGLAPKELASLLDRLDTVEFWVKGVREFAYQEAKAGRVPPGYKLVPKRATRKWADVEMAQKALEGAIVDSVFRECLTTPELKSPAQIEKIIGKGNKTLVDELTVSISSGDTLVHDSDKREASSNKTRIAEMFGD